MKYLALAAALLLAAPAHAQYWFSLSGRDSDASATVVEVDLDTVRLRDGSGEAAIRVTHGVLQPHPGGFGYRSMIATASIDCVRKGVSLVSAAYFALPNGEGVRVGLDSVTREPGIPARVVERIPAYARQALLRAACPSGPP
jgi:hypothetical protein